jgi:hypothetical protein
MFGVAKGDHPCPASAPYNAAPWPVAGGACGDGYTGNPTGFSSDSPRAIAFGYGQPNAPASGGAQAEVTRIYQYGRTSIPQPHCPISNTVHYYAYSQIDSVDHPDGGTSCDSDGLGHFVWQQWQFDANGDGVLFRQFHEWYTDGPSTVVDRMSGPLASTSLTNPPNAPPEPTPSGGCTPIYQKYSTSGYVVTQQWAVVDWAFDDLS